MSNPRQMSRRSRASLRPRSTALALLLALAPACRRLRAVPSHVAARGDARSLDAPVRDATRDVAAIRTGVVRLRPTGSDGAPGAVTTLSAEAATPYVLRATLRGSEHRSHNCELPGDADAGEARDRDLYVTLDDPVLALEVERLTPWLELRVRSTAATAILLDPVEAPATFEQRCMASDREGQAALLLRDLPAGRYELRVAGTGGGTAPYELTVALRPGLREPRVPAVPPPSPQDVWARWEKRVAVSSRCGAEPCAQLSLVIAPPVNLRLDVPTDALAYCRSVGGLEVRCSADAALRLLVEARGAGQYELTYAELESGACYRRGRPAPCPVTVLARQRFTVPAALRLVADPRGHDLP